jgi:S-DNA-T family DNA segregation ATPase FtsK/SpoIIIE
MKKTDKVASVVVGILLFTIAAVFSVGLLMQLLYFGAGTPGEQSGLYRFGEMLVSVYGVSSVLIPVFLIVAGVFCFAENWSAQKAICLLISIIPFFTSVVGERICRNIAAEDEGPVAAVKIISLVVIALLMIIAEYLVTLVIVGTFSKKNSQIEKVDVEKDDEAEAPVDEKEMPAEHHDAAQKWSFKSMFVGGKKNEAHYDDDAEINAAVDKSITEATKSDWTLEELLKNSKHKTPNDTQTEKKLSTDSQYGKYDSGNYVKEASMDDSSKAISSLEEFDEPEEIDAKKSSADESTTADFAEDADLNDIDALMKKAAVLGNETAAALPEVSDEVADKVAGAKETELPDMSDIMALDEKSPETDDGESDASDADDVNETDAANDADDADDVDDGADSLDADETDVANDAIDEEAANDEPNMAADPWNVTNTGNANGSRVVYLGKVVKQSRKNPAPDMIDLDDPAGLVEPTGGAPEEESNIDEDESDDRADDAEASAAPCSDKTPPNFEMGSGIEEEPKNPNTASNEHAMLSSLDSVFAKMDMDAHAAVDAKSGTDAANISAAETIFNPTASAVVDSTGAVKAEQTEQSEKLPANKAAVAAGQLATKTSAQAVIPRAVPKRVKHGPYKIPTELLTAYADNPYWIIDTATNMAAQNLKETLNEFKIEAEVTGIRKGPVVTMFEILPAPGVKLSKIVALQDNIALRLAASSIRIVAPIPGKRAVGIEVPNKDRAIVSFRECIEQNLPEWKKMAVPVVLGKDIQGETQIMDLVKTPHLLIAGSTGSGKSVCVNSMILSILYKRSPNEVKMILIDPKIVELKLYNDIPHLLTPVITEPKRAMQALQYCLCEMERRYALLDGLGVRDIANYNKRIQERKICTEKLPYIVVIIDEFADLMATTGKELEGVVARLAAMSRAVGIHLVLATQRPSIDVITGLIKANIPSRIAFMVASKTDSRIIIDQVGAEKLLGKGDMLYSSSTDPFPVRIQGTFVSDTEVEDVVEAVKQWGEPEYIDDEIFVDDDEDESDGQMSLFSDGEDPLYEKALDIVVQAGKASASYIQRRLKIGYNRAARLVEEMEDRGIVGPANGSKPREIIHMP